MTSPTALTASVPGEHPWVGILAGLFFVVLGVREVRAARRVMRSFGPTPPPPRSWLLRHTAFGLSRTDPAKGFRVGVSTVVIGGLVAVVCLLHTLRGR